MSPTTPVKIFSFIFLFISLIGCGSYKEVDVKKYRLFVHTEDPEVQKTFAALIEKFNAECGIQALHYTETKDNANSFITLTAGLENRDGKVGWGQWSRESKQESPFSLHPGERPERENNYSMNLEFDKAYVFNRMNSRDEQRQLELYTLFTHEAGHGFQLGHAKERRDVMYPDISGEKDFPPHYARVRNHF